jgi:hypothetical protein
MDIAQGTIHLETLQIAAWCAPNLGVRDSVLSYSIVLDPPCSLFDLGYPIYNHL